MQFLVTFFIANENSPQQAMGYQKEDASEPARSKLRGIVPKEIDTTRNQFCWYDGLQETEVELVLPS